MRRELLAGCGNSRAKRFGPEGFPAFTNLTTLDIDPACGADVIHDLDVTPYPFADDTFDEAHAYDTLEHCGRQGDWRAFFAQFGEFHRILKPGGVMCGIVPSAASPWAWGDPGHTRLITQGTLTFLIQPAYAEQVGVTPMTDYRAVWKGDFDLLMAHDDGQTFAFALKAVKPARVAS